MRKNDQNVALSDLKAGDYVHVVLIRCPSGKATALKVVFIGQRDAPTTSTTPPTTTTDTCGQGETNALVVSIGDGTITLRTTSSEGVKDWSIDVTGDTVVRKNDQNVALSDLAAGDSVHVVLIRCSSGKATALKLVYLGHPSE